MQTAKIFKNGRSQAVRLPKEFRFNESEVYIKKFEDLIMLIPKKNPWSSLINSLNHFTDDFMQDRNQPKSQERESL